MDVCVLASVYVFSCAFCVNLQIFIKGSFHVKNNTNACKTQGHILTTAN